MIAPEASDELLAYARRFRGYCWCMTCSSYAPAGPHECVPTRRTAVIEAGRSLVKRGATLFGKPLADMLDATLVQLEDAPKKRQGVWWDARGYWADIGGGFKHGPFETAGIALAYYTRNKTARSKPVRIVEGAAPAEAPPAAAPRRGSIDVRQLGQLVGEVPPALCVYQRDGKILLAQEGAVLHFDVEAAGTLTGLIHRATSGSSWDLPPEDVDSTTADG